MRWYVYQEGRNMYGGLMYELHSIREDKPPRRKGFISVKRADRYSARSYAERIRRRKEAV